MPEIPATLTRRTLMTTAAAVTGAAAFPAIVNAATSAAGSSAFRQTIDAIADEALRFSPEQATSLGVDVGARAGLRAKLSDGSAAGNARFAAAVDSMMTRLHRVGPAGLSPQDTLRWQTTHYALESAEQAKPFFYATATQGFQGGTTPYAVTQQSGTIASTPEFLNSQHPINTRADAEAYLSRVATIARQLDNETAQIVRDAARGVMPPSFVGANVLGILTKYRRTPAAQQKLVTSLATRTAAEGIAGDWGPRAKTMVETMVYPALDRQIAAFTAANAKAVPGAGVQRLPMGDAYYIWALRLGTTTTQTPAEVHRIGLAQNEELKARMDVLLRKQGMTSGTVGERVQVLNKDPQQLFSDDDAGRAQLIAYCNGRIAAIRPLLPKVSHLGLKADVMVKRVPEDIQDGAALGYMNFASLDGSRPAIYYINLKSTTLWPKYQIPTLTAHEGVPGHTYQGAYLAEHHAEIPLIASLIGFNAFVEGWALYAEQLMDEQGLYADDPFGQIGYLQAQQFRACRLVTDTGLHNLHWTREQGVAFLTEQTGKGATAMTSEVDRYCVAPGQACGYKTGHNEILRLRGIAQAALGPKFDLAAFNDTLIKTGGVPLSVLPAAVDGYVKGARG